MLLIDSLNQLGHKVRQLEDSGTVTLESMKASMSGFAETYGNVSEMLQELPDKHFVGVARIMTARLENIIREYELLVMQTNKTSPVPVNKNAVDQTTMFARLERVNKEIAKAQIPQTRKMVITQLVYADLESWAAWQLDSLNRLVPLCK